MFPAAQTPSWPTTAGPRPALLPGRMLLLAFLDLILVLGLACHLQRRQEPRARQGVLDLTGRDLRRGAPVTLGGAWAIFPGQLLTPQDLQRQPEPGAWVDLPSGTDGPLAPGHSLAGRGCATLRLQVLTGPCADPLAIRMANIAIPYRLWVDGRLAAESGRPGRSAAEESLGRPFRFARFPADGQPIQLVLQVSNFHFAGKWLQTPLQLGRADDLESAQLRKWGLALFVLGALAVMGIYHLALYLGHRKHPSGLYFGAHCLLWAGFILCAKGSDEVIRLFLPGLPAEGLFRACWFCFFLVTPLSYQFFRSLYPLEFRRWILYPLLGLSIVYSLLALAAPIRAVSAALPLFYVVLGSVKLVYCLCALFKAARHGRAGAVHILVGYTLLGAIGLNEVLYSQGLIRTGHLLPLGMLFFLLSQAMAMSVRISRMSAALEAETAERARLAQEVVTLIQEERRQISYELHDGLCQELTGARLQCSELECLWPEGNEGSQELARLSGLLEDSVTHAYDLSRGLWQEEHPDGDLRAGLADLVQRAAEASGIAMAFRPDCACSTCTSVHGPQAHRIAQEAITNCVKHSQASQVTVTLDCKLGASMNLTVLDNGIGHGSGRSSKGGLGLRMMEQRARKCGGSFRIQDGQDGGTEVTCSLPCASRGGTC
ncbi:MAG: 7TM diverse intracellular signaling domain-containing protein [Holophaga sp.]|nr:7TM diverse intracellular signaling domain-containing protein [Holophaga sp.]